MAVDTGTFELTMPAMGDSVTEGTILEWHKQEGDTVAVDEIVVEISTDKVDAEVPAPVAGKIVKLHAAEGDTVEIGALLCEIAPDGATTAAPNGNGNGATPTAPAPEAAAPETAAPEAPTEAKIIDIVTPGGGESVTEGTILEWAVKVGDAVNDGDTIVEISTDKVDMELPAPADGTITEILAEEGATVGVGQVIARMTVGASSPAAVPVGVDDGSAPGKAAAPSPASATSSTGPVASAPGTGATPVAQRVAAGLGVNLAAVAGTARGGRITKDDVLAAAATVVELPEGAEKIKGAGAALARYMDESRSIPTATSFRTLAVTTLDARRKQLKDAGLKVSFTHLIAYAIARAGTEDMPVMAHHFVQSQGVPYRVDDGVVNLGLAVDVEK
jgi:2-oxoglutarate dehydrogenase E1 component